MLLGWYSLQLVLTHLLPRDCQEKDKPQIIRDVPFVQTPEDSSHMWVILSLSLKKTHVSIFFFLFFVKQTSLYDWIGVYNQSSAFSYISVL